jgi:MYXO-CTERM domain-containing protein
VGAKCLTWTAQGLYACANEFTDGFTLGLSSDQGKTFTPLMHLRDLCGPLACGAATSAGKTCPELWGATQLSLGGASCASDGGVDGGGTGGGGGSGSGGSSSSGGGGGCACSTPDATPGSALSPLSLLALALLRSRRRVA